MKNKKINFFKTKKVTTSFAIIALIGGFLFLNKGITGNIILSDKYSFDLVSLVGLALVGCAVVLGVYIVKKK